MPEVHGVYPWPERPDVTVSGPESTVAVVLRVLSDELSAARRVSTRGWGWIDGSTSVEIPATGQMSLTLSLLLLLPGRVLCGGCDDRRG